MAPRSNCCRRAELRDLIDQRIGAKVSGNVEVAFDVRGWSALQ
jgi:hypothetical protein